MTPVSPEFLPRRPLRVQRVAHLAPAQTATSQLRVSLKSVVQRLRVEEKARASAAQDRGGFLPFFGLPNFPFLFTPVAAFWKANLTGDRRHS